MDRDSKNKKKDFKLRWEKGLENDLSQDFKNMNKQTGNFTTTLHSENYTCDISRAVEPYS